MRQGQKRSEVSNNIGKGNTITSRNKKNIQTTHIFFFFIWSRSLFSHIIASVCHTFLNGVRENYRDANYKEVVVSQHQFRSVNHSIWMCHAKRAHQLPFSNVFIPVHVILYHLLHGETWGNIKTGNKDRHRHKHKTIHTCTVRRFMQVEMCWCVPTLGREKWQLLHFLHLCPLQAPSVTDALQSYTNVVAAVYLCNYKSKNVVNQWIFSVNVRTPSICVCTMCS